MRQTRLRFYGHGSLDLKVGSISWPRLKLVRMLIAASKWCLNAAERLSGGRQELTLSDARLIDDESDPVEHFTDRGRPQ